MHWLTLSPVALSTEKMVPLVPVLPIYTNSPAIAGMTLWTDGAGVTLFAAHHSSKDHLWLPSGEYETNTAVLFWSPPRIYTLPSVSMLGIPLTEDSVSETSCFFHFTVPSSALIAYRLLSGFPHTAYTMFPPSYTAGAEPETYPPIDTTHLRVSSPVCATAAGLTTRFFCLWTLAPAASVTVKVTL